MPVSTFGRVKKRAWENVSENKLLESIVCNRHASEKELPFEKIETPKEFRESAFEKILSVFCSGGMPRISRRGCFEISAKSFLSFLVEIEFIILERRRVHHELFIVLREREI